MIDILSAFFYYGRYALITVVALAAEKMHTAVSSLINRKTRKKNESLQEFITSMLSVKLYLNTFYIEWDLFIAFR